MQTPNGPALPQGSGSRLSNRSSTGKRVRVEYTADFAHKLDRILERQTALEVALGELRASIMPRHEIDAEIEKRVAQSAYLADKTAIENRLHRLEEAPTATWTRGGIVGSLSVGCLGVLLAAVSILVAILTAVHVI